MKTDFTDRDIRNRRDEYKRALKNETQASVSVREMWRQMVAMFDQLLKYREEEMR